MIDKELQQLLRDQNRLRAGMAVITSHAWLRLSAKLPGETDKQNFERMGKYLMDRGLLTPDEFQEMKDASPYYDQDREQSSLF